MTAFFSRALILSLIAAALLLVAGCSDDDEAPTATDDGRILALTTLSVFADFVHNVGGERVVTGSLVPPGADPHTWEPDPQQVASVEDADIFFANGLDLEPAAMNIIEANIDDQPLVLLAEEADVEVHAGEDDGHDHDEGDPHLWMDPANAIAYVEVVRDHLSELDPEGATDYRSNAERYTAEITGADIETLSLIDQVPQDNRKLITTHDAFGYYAHHIGFEITAFVSEDPGQDTSPGAIRDIIDAVEDQHVPAVFSEPQVSAESDILDQVAEDTGAEVCELYSDAFDDRVATYLDLMRFNANEIARCLGGDGG